jgi:hypothetical protein
MARNECKRDLISTVPDVLIREHIDTLLPGSDIINLRLANKNTDAIVMNLSGKFINYDTLGDKNRIIKHNITHLKVNNDTTDFGRDADIFNNIVHLKFGENFNSKINFSPNSKLRILELGNNFNQKIDLPEGLTHLSLGNHFNQKIDLPEGLTHLRLGPNFNRNIKIPQSLRVLQLPNIDVP